MAYKFYENFRLKLLIETTNIVSIKIYGKYKAISRYRNKVVCFRKTLKQY